MTIFVLLTVRWPRLVLAGLLAWVASSLAGTALARCDFPVAKRTTGIVKASFTPAAAVPPGHIGVTYVGHSSFLIESPAGVTIVTDYNDYVRPPFAPDIATMNLAHDTHHSRNPDPAIKFVLRGWNPAGGIAQHQLSFKDVRVHNVPTNIRDYGNTRNANNSIFIYEIAALCIAHLGHLHHLLTPEHLEDLGKIDVVMAPIDGAYTLNHDLMAEILDQIKAPIVIPMHYFGPSVLARFIARLGDRYSVTMNGTPHVTLSRASLPPKPEILVLPGG